MEFIFPATFNLFLTSIHQHYDRFIEGWDFINLKKSCYSSNYFKYSNEENFKNCFNNLISLNNKNDNNLTKIYGCLYYIIIENCRFEIYLKIILFPNKNYLMFEGLTRNYEINLSKFLIRTLELILKNNLQIEDLN